MATQIRFTHTTLISGVNLSRGGLWAAVAFIMCAHGLGGQLCSAAHPSPQRKSSLSTICKTSATITPPPPPSSSPSLFKALPAGQSCPFDKGIGVCRMTGEIAATHGVLFMSSVLSVPPPPRMNLPRSPHSAKRGTRRVQQLKFRAHLPQKTQD